ncbi:MAG: hypothetical protein FJ315_03785 [SAR202 cluster bacterium]|nr:hypothetical protein [SAR202 cluster bacterium]
MTLDIQRLIAQGYGWGVTVGSFSTGIVGGGAGTALDLDQPELAIGVGARSVLVPIYFEAVVQGGISTADSDETEALFAVDSLGLWTGDGTFTSENPSNMNSKYDKGAPVRVGSAFTADMTTTPRNGGAAADPVLDMELAGIVETADQAGTAANVAYRTIRLVYEPLHPEAITGPASLFGYWGGTIATVGGFARLRFLVLPEELYMKEVGL